jgi:2-methylisocitrate lyase-like PEP mutase family enzyme
MMARSALAARFLELHRAGDPLIMPNPWDIGSARVLEALGFEALATTSSGFAATLGRPDGSVTRSEALQHAHDIVTNVKLPVSADLENGFGDEPEAVAATITGAVDVGLAGCSIEDWSGEEIYDVEQAVERVAAAVEAADGRLALTARAENWLHDRHDLDDTITRLQRYQEAGADVLYAPGLTRREDLESLVASVGRPLNVLLPPHGPVAGELAEIGVSRISIGGTFASVAYGALVRAAREILATGPYSFWDEAREGRGVTEGAFRSRT